MIPWKASQASGDRRAPQVYEGRGGIPATSSTTADTRPLIVPGRFARTQRGYVPRPVGGGAATPPVQVTLDNACI